MTDFKFAGVSKEAGIALLCTTVLLSSQSILTTLSKNDVAGYSYSVISATFFSECVKFMASFILKKRDTTVYQNQGNDIVRDILPWSLPAIIYVINNNLIFVALKYLSPASFQLLGNLKILTTAVLFKLIMKKPMSELKWASIANLAAGVTIGELNCASADGSKESESIFLGAIIMIIYAIFSATAGICTEFLYKRDTGSSMHDQNLRLYAFGIIINGLGMLTIDRSTISNGIFSGYTFVTFLLILNNGGTGLAISAVMKYADNIIKLFSVAASMILTSILSIFLFQIIPTTQLMLGIVVVVVSLYLNHLDSKYQSIFASQNSSNV